MSVHPFCFNSFHLASLLMSWWRPTKSIHWCNQWNTYYLSNPFPPQIAKSLGPRGVERPLERTVLGVGLAVGKGQSAAVRAGEKRWRILVRVTPRMPKRQESGTEIRGKYLIFHSMDDKYLVLPKLSYCFFFIRQNCYYAQDGLRGLCPPFHALGPGACGPRRLDERASPALQEAVARGACQAAMAGRLQRRRRHAAHRWVP